MLKKLPKENYTSIYDKLVENFAAFAEEEANTETIV